MTSLYRQRTAFEKQVLSELSPRLKKAKWKKSSCALFTQAGEFYQDVFVSVHRNAALTTAELRFKPMAIDPILWDILDIPETVTSHSLSALGGPLRAQAYQSTERNWRKQTTPPEMSRRV